MVLSIIVHYNNVPDCLRCVHSLLKIKLDGHKILIVDNCSENENYSELINVLKSLKVEIIRTSKNGGFGYGVNRGVEYYEKVNNSFEFIHVINSDSEVINYEYVNDLYKVMDKNKDIGIIGPGVYCADGITVQNTILPFSSLVSAITFKNRYKEFSKITSPPSLVDVDCVNGVCFLVNKKLFSDIEGFCEDYFMYNEEQDLCFKIKKAGKRVVFWSGESIIHYGASSIETKNIDWRYLYIRRNQVLFIRKHRSIIEAFVLASVFIFFSIPKFLSKKYQKNFSWFDFVKKIFFVLK